jgi:HemY protein
LQFEQGQLEQALATLDHLRSAAPKHGLILKLLEKVYVRLADWKNLLKLLPYLRKAKLITDDELQKFEKNTYQELLHSAGQRNADVAAIQQIWQSIPKKIQAHPSVLASYVRLMLPYPETASDMESLINKAVKKSWDKELVRLYGLLQTNDVKTQLAHAEAWNKQYGNQPVLLLTLGRLCMRCQLWGQARHYLEDSIKLEPSVEAYLEYGKLLEQLGETSAALQNYRQGLLLG